jgi:hypothetical protein
MINKLLLFGLFFFVALSLHAQEFNGGVYGGLVASQLDGDHYKGYNKAGFMAGAYVNRFLMQKTFAQMGIRYIQKGSKKADIKTGEYYKSELHYAEIPVTIRYYYYKKIDFEGGIALGYLIQSLEDTDGAGLTDPAADFNKFEFCVVGGINYTWTEKISFSAQFSYSLLPVRPYSQLYASYMDRGQYNNLVSFSIMYHISSWK